jgi:predicted DCC family thiol-disulfide oxidoreductase YuxK
MSACTATEPNGAIVLYDGGCPFCLKSVALLKKLDWLHRLSYHDARDTERLPESAVPLEPERLMREMHVLTPDRQMAYTGFRAWRWIAARLPLLWPVWPMLFVPGIPWVGQRLYLWVARNRYNLVPCHDGQCAIGQPPKDQTKISQQQPDSR